MERGREMECTFLASMLAMMRHERNVEQARQRQSRAGRRAGLGRRERQQGQAVGASRRGRQLEQRRLCFQAAKVGPENVCQSWQQQQMQTAKELQRERASERQKYKEREREEQRDDRVEEEREGKAGKEPAAAASVPPTVLVFQHLELVTLLEQSAVCLCMCVWCVC